MTPEAHMEFQLSQAKLRAVIATLSVVCGVAIPFFGFLGYRYIENMDAASLAVGRLTTEIAVLNTQMTYLREDIGDLQGTVKILQDRANKALYIVGGPMPKLTYLQAHELVPKAILDKRGLQALECMDFRILHMVDLLRGNLKKEGHDNGFVVNNWKTGGAKTQSGLRTPGQSEYSNTSQHSFGRAVDFTTKTPIKAIHKHILLNLDLYPHIRFIEVDISWCHVDCRDNFDDDRIKLWSPKRGFVSVAQYLKELG